jgi:hypothetical protein
VWSPAERKRKEKGKKKKEKIKNVETLKPIFCSAYNYSVDSLPLPRQARAQKCSSADCPAGW